MKNIFLVILVMSLILTSLKSQELYKFSDTEIGVKCQVYDFGYYILLDVENRCNSSIYIPNLFEIDNDCERMPCYLSNDISQDPFHYEFVSVVKIEPGEKWGFIIKDYGAYRDISQMEILFSYSKKEIDSDILLNLIDKVQSIMIPYTN